MLHFLFQILLGRLLRLFFWHLRHIRLALSLWDDLFWLHLLIYILARLNSAICLFAKNLSHLSCIFLLCCNDWFELYRFYLLCLSLFELNILIVLQSLTWLHKVNIGS